MPVGSRQNRVQAVRKVSGSTDSTIPREAGIYPIRYTERKERKDVQTVENGTNEDSRASQSRGRRRRQPTSRTLRQTSQSRPEVLERNESGSDCKKGVHSHSSARKVEREGSRCASRGLHLSSTTRCTAKELDVAKQEEKEEEDNKEGYADEEQKIENSTQERKVVNTSMEDKATSHSTKGSFRLTNSDSNKELHKAIKVRGSLSKTDITEKAKFVNEVVEKEIISQVFKIDNRFTFDILHAGSYYERLKVGEADEFDIMVQLNAAKLSNIFQPRFCVARRHSRHLVGFAYLEYQSHFDGHKKWEDLLETGGPDSRPLLSPKLILEHFKELLSQRLHQINCVGKQPWRSYCEPSLHGPAVKLTFCLANDKTLDIDVVLCIQSQHWPPVANNWGVLNPLQWPGAQQVENIKKRGCHVVPKVNPRDQKCWRTSFSLAEKDLLSPKSIDEDKEHYKIVKVIFERHKASLEPLCSYHLKTLFLWLRSDGNWTEKRTQFKVIEYFIQQLLEKVRMKELPHFFIGHNLNLFSDLSDAQVTNITTCLKEIIKNK